MLKFSLELIFKFIHTFPNSVVSNFLLLKALIEVFSLEMVFKFKACFSVKKLMCDLDQTNILP